MWNEIPITVLRRVRLLVVLCNRTLIDQYVPGTSTWLAFNGQ